MRIIKYGILAVVSSFLLFVLWMNVTPGHYDYSFPPINGDFTCVPVVYGLSHNPEPKGGYPIDSFCEKPLVKVPNDLLISLSKLDFYK